MLEKVSEPLDSNWKVKFDDLDLDGEGMIGIIWPLFTTIKPAVHVEEDNHYRGKAFQTFVKFFLIIFFITLFLGNVHCKLYWCYFQDSVEEIGIKSGVPFNFDHVAGIIKTQLKDDKQCFSHIWNWLVLKKSVMWCAAS